MISSLFCVFFNPWFDLNSGLFLKNIRCGSARRATWRTTRCCRWWGVTSATSGTTGLVWDWLPNRLMKSGSVPLAWTRYRRRRSGRRTRRARNDEETRAPISCHLLRLWPIFFFLLPLRWIFSTANYLFLLKSCIFRMSSHISVTLTVQIPP